MNYLTYPLKVMNITQGYNDNYTHKRHSDGNLKDYPIDDACGSGNNSYFYCPCDEMVVKKVYGVGLRASNTIWLESTTPVITPTFTDYITIMIVHPEDKDLKNVYVGRKYQRDEALFPKGADGFATGPHFHITLGRGKMSGSGWAKNNLGLWILKTTGYNIKPEHGMFIDKNFTTIKNTRNIEFLSLNDEEKEDHKNHIEHISTITIIALLLHNIIEGMALYGVATTDLKSGILMLTGIGLHNLPFGFQISATKKNNKNKMLITLLVLSGGIGGLIFLIFGNLSPILEGIIIALTLGMLLHILFFELLKEVYEEIHKKETIYGIIIGIILLVVINIL